MSTLFKEITAHYTSVWHSQFEVKKWHKGPVIDLPPTFSVLEFKPCESRKMWTYATCCMSQLADTEPLELHLFSPVQSESHIELLTTIAHYHRTGCALGVGHTVFFGRPWMRESQCDYGLVSLPYLDGPSLEECRLIDGIRPIRFLWLVPITKAERDYKKAAGIEALERKFEEANFNYLDPTRESVV